jgi:hypothetical protein
MRNAYASARRQFIDAGRRAQPAKTHFIASVDTSCRRLRAAPESFDFVYQSVKRRCLVDSDHTLAASWPGSDAAAARRSAWRWA